jgi:transcription antitermination factor NusG
LWYVAFAQQIHNIVKIDNLLRQRTCAHQIWAPYYQEFCKFEMEVELVDRLLYPGYVIVGLKDETDFDYLDQEMKTAHLGYMLGNFTNNLREKEFTDMLSVSVHSEEVPAANFNVKPGDHIVISSGPCSGLHGVVQEINTSGQATLKVYFMHREITMLTSVTDLQNLGGAISEEN